MARLIDADKIIFREIDEIGGEYEPYLGCSKSQIDSLPSVTPQPCEDAISRKAVINQIFYSTDNSGDVVLGSALRERIERLPSVTPQPKTGHWIDDTRLGYHVSVCSNCNWRGHGDSCLIYKPKYCPNCGADMREVEE